jgi:hypothetical protein
MADTTKITIGIIGVLIMGGPTWRSGDDGYNFIGFNMTTGAPIGPSNKLTLYALPNFKLSLSGVNRLTFKY